ASVDFFLPNSGRSSRSPKPPVPMGPGGFYLFAPAFGSRTVERGWGSDRHLPASGAHFRRVVRSLTKSLLTRPQSWDIVDVSSKLACDQERSQVPGQAVPGKREDVTMSQTQ